MCKTVTSTSIVIDTCMGKYLVKTFNYKAYEIKNCSKMQKFILSMYNKQHSNIFKLVWT